MKIIQIVLILVLTSFFNLSKAQCDYSIPPEIKTIDFGARQITFSNLVINKKKTTHFNAFKGETITITVDVESTKKGDYCPGCIVQIYWGIHGYTSVCAKNYYGYNFRKQQSVHQFVAPNIDGVYYITMGGGLDYSCRNRIKSPFCSSEYAIAVLIVGEPKKGNEISLTQFYKGPSLFLKTAILRSGCVGNFTKIEWFYENQKLDFDDKREIPVLNYGNYKVQWVNCSTDEKVEQSIVVKESKNKRKQKSKAKINS